jgi:hypothetical protein
MGKVKNLAHFYQNKMAVNKSIKRVITKSGESRYYLNGKRIKAQSGIKRFLKQNPNLSKQSLTDQEKKSLQRSKKAKETYKTGWKFKNVAKVPYSYVDILTKLAIINPKKIKNKDLYNVFENGKRKFNDFIDIKKLIDQKAKDKKLIFQWCNEVGLPNYRGRDFESFANNRIENIVDIVNLLKTTAYKRFKFYVTDRQGDLHSGRVLGLLALRDFEIDVGSQLQALVPNAAFIKFCYDYTIQYEKKEIEIDLTDLYPNENPDPQDKDGGYKSLQWYVNNSAGTGPKEQLIINDKYKDVEITIQFS